MTAFYWDDNIATGIRRIELEHKVLAGMLLHRPRGVWGWCACGIKPPGANGLTDHIRVAVADVAGIDLALVEKGLAAHRGASGKFGGEMRCDCGVTVIDRDYGLDIHKARAVALAAIPDDVPPGRGAIEVIL